MKLKISQNCLMLEDESICLCPAQGPGPVVDPVDVAEFMQSVAHRYNNFTKTLEALTTAASGLRDAGKVGQAQWLAYRIAELEALE